jgi:hypothetical protein
MGLTTVLKLPPKFMTKCHNLHKEEDLWLGKSDHWLIQGGKQFNNTIINYSVGDLPFSLWYA